jgi:hypothetical protein
LIRQDIRQGGAARREPAGNASDTSIPSWTVDVAVILDDRLLTKGYTVGKLLFQLGTDDTRFVGTE